MLYLGLGSNLGDKQKNLESAISLINQHVMHINKRSSIIENDPLLPPNPKPEWQYKKFLNMVIAGEPKQNFTPPELLELIKKIEVELGRKPAAVWAPRIIDIDILAWGKLICSSQTLVIPHKELLNRDFALKPLLEITPDWKYPKP